ncbi:hypothetical protein GGI13_008712, partial [Coemansia sp. RSA 455]
MNNRLDVDQFKRFLVAIRKLEQRVEREQIKYLEKMDRGTTTVKVVDTSDTWELDNSVVQNGSGDTRFESLVMGSSSPRRPKTTLLTNPLAEKTSTKTPVASGWEWDTPTFGSSPVASKNRLVAVEVDFAESSATPDDDDFGSFSSFLPAPRPAPSTAPLSSRLRTTTPLSATTQSARKLGGATKL